MPRCQTTAASECSPIRTKLRATFITICNASCGLLKVEARHNRDVANSKTPLIIRAAVVAANTDVRPVVVDKPETTETTITDRPWIVIVWNDPINLMSYVTFVFQKLFGYSLEKATALMLDVHHKGRAVVSSGPRERAEFDVYRLHEHGLWATMQKGSNSL